MAIDLPILQRCDEMLVLAIEDWQDSLGVRQELGTAIALQKPVTMITEEEIEHLPVITHAAKCFLSSSIFTEVYDAA
jgi:nucleoside 2-deoxyribosyltransferase